MSLIFNGISSESLKLNITSRQVYDAAVYDVTAVEVPGRSGDVMIPQDRFKNKTLVYRGFLNASDFSGSSDWEKLSNGTQNLKGMWMRVPLLVSKTGVYKPLKDTYDPGMTRQARIEDLKITPVFDQAIGAEVEITFNAQPFMTVAQSPIIISTETGRTATLENPYFFEALPLIEIPDAHSGDGFTVNGETWALVGSIGSGHKIVCDSQEMEWLEYDGSTLVGLANNKISGPSHFPILNARPSGTNTITLNGVSRLDVTPRWRTL